MSDIIKDDDKDGVKILFDDKGYDFIEVYRDKTSKKIYISMSARSVDNPLKSTNLSVDLTEAEFLQLISELNLI
jgi:hypothetical protein